MFVESIISRIGPVLRPPRRTFIRGTSSGWAALCLTTPVKACFRRLWVSVVRAVPRKAAYAGGSLTRTGYLLIALTIAAIVIAVALSASTVGDELGRAVHLSWWFV
jgi:hypothetical protein